MKVKNAILVFSLFFTGSITAQTVKWFAGKENKMDDDPNLKINNSTSTPDSAYFYNPEGMTWDNNGNMWITERNKIRLLYNGKVYNRAGFLGDGNTSHGYADATGNQARFYAPSAIVSDANRVLFVVDAENHAIRKVDAFTTIGNGQKVVTFSGNGTPGSSNSPARFNVPKGIVRDANGNFYVTEYMNSCIRKITSTGTVSVLAGKITVDGNVDSIGNKAEFSSPYGIAQYDNNYLVITDYGNSSIRKVHMTSGKVTTICGVSGENWFADGTLKQARFKEPRGITVVDGKIYVCDGSALRVIDEIAGTVKTFAGSTAETGNSDGEGGNAKFGTLGGLAYDGKIKLYVTDLYYNVIKTVTINGLVPIANFTANKTAALVDEIITITNTSSGKPATSQLWEITSTGLSHSIVNGSLTTSSIGIKFKDAGFYHISLKVTNSYGKDSIYKGSYISVSTTGISYIPEDMSVGVYPNPSNGVYTLQSLHGNYPIKSYTVIDITGKSILRKDCNNSLTETFDISAVQAGFYYIRVKTSAGTNSLKLQKL